MRKWYKYIHDKTRSGKIFLPMDKDFNDHKISMGGYNPDDSYKNKKDFFEKYFFNVNYGRIENYHSFLIKHLKKDQKILSVASGRSVNELFLSENEFNIVCSDLDYYEAYQQTLELFPNYQFTKLDILQNPAPERYDSIICLSLIYLFDEHKYNLFLDNISRSININGYFILDSAGSPDNLLSYIMHDLFLRFEAKMRVVLKYLLKRKKDGYVIKEFGYRRSNKDIISAAEKYGFKLIENAKFGFLVDFYRSDLLRKLIQKSNLLKKFFNLLGKNIPYTRLFLFQKIR